MTTLALQSLSFSTKLLNGLYEGVKKTLHGMMIGYMLARQNQANRYIAERLICEYRDTHTVASLHAELNRKTLESLTKEFS
jgi:hypothetical protein